MSSKEFRPNAVVSVALGKSNVVYTPPLSRKPWIAPGVERTQGLELQCWLTMSPALFSPPSSTTAVSRAPGTSGIEVKLALLKTNIWFLPSLALAYRPTISPMSLIFHAWVKAAEPRKSIDVYTPPLSRNPCVPILSRYQPTMSPFALIPAGMVESLLGNRIEVNTPPRSRYPKSCPTPSLVLKSPTTSPKRLIPTARVNVAPGKVIEVKTPFFSLKPCLSSGSPNVYSPTISPESLMSVPKVATAPV